MSYMSMLLVVSLASDQCPEETNFHKFSLNFSSKNKKKMIRKQSECEPIIIISISSVYPLLHITTISLFLQHLALLNPGGTDQWQKVEEEE